VGIGKTLAQLGRALAGRFAWLRLKRKYRIDRGIYVLLMCEEDGELNRQALRHIGDLVAYRKAAGVVVLTDRAQVAQAAKACLPGVIDVVQCRTATVEALLSFCELYRFGEQLLVVSLTRPYGNKAWLAVGKNGVTVEDIVCLGIFCIRTWSGSSEDHG
jgi:hypothetical protein